MVAEAVPADTEQLGTRLQFPLPHETVTELRQQAAKVRVSDLVLTVIGAVFVAIGWLAWLPFVISRECIKFAYVCVRRGWLQAQGLPLNEPSIRELMDENHMLRLELERLQ